MGAHAFAEFLAVKVRNLAFHGPHQHHHHPGSVQERRAGGIIVLDLDFSDELDGRLGFVYRGAVEGGWGCAGELEVGDLGGGAG